MSLKTQFWKDFLCKGEGNAIAAPTGKSAIAHPTDLSPVTTQSFSALSAQLDEMYD